MPSTFIPYDAGAASEGTQEIPMHGIPSPHHSPGPALSVDSAAALRPLTPIIDGVEESSDYSVRDVHDVKCGWQWRLEQTNMSGSGGGRGEAIRNIYYSDRQLPPGHDPGADSGEAPTAGSVAHGH